MRQYSWITNEVDQYSWINTSCAFWFHGHRRTDFYRHQTWCLLQPGALSSWLRKGFLWDNRIRNISIFCVGTSWERHHRVEKLDSVHLERWIMTFTFWFGWELFAVKMELADLLNGRKGLKRPAAKRAARPKKRPKKRPAAVGTRDGDGDGDGSGDDVEVILLLD